MSFSRVRNSPNDPGCSPNDAGAASRSAWNASWVNLLVNYCFEFILLYPNFVLTQIFSIHTKSMMPVGGMMPPMMPGMPAGKTSTRTHLPSYCELKFQSEKVDEITKLPKNTFTTFTCMVGFVFLLPVIHPPVSHRPGITHMPQVPAVNVLSRPAVPAVITSSAQPDIAKPLFPSAGQVQSSNH